jgi:hypothetical protein
MKNPLLLIMRKALLRTVLSGILLIITLFTGFSQEVTGSGAFSYTYPLDLPQGRNNMGPHLSLVYNSNAQNGMLGKGWSLSGLSVITRDSSYPIVFDDSADRFLLDGQKLIKGADNYYHTENETYIRALLRNPDSTTSYWVVRLIPTIN